MAYKRKKHGLRPHTPPSDKRCPVKTAYTTYEAADKVRRRTPGAERVHRGECCGWYHVTSMTEQEFAAAMATRGVQDSAERGRLDLSPAEYLELMDRREREAQALEDRLAAERAQPRADAGRPGSPPELGGQQTRPAPTPAEVARRLQARGDAGSNLMR